MAAVTSSTCDLYLALDETSKILITIVREKSQTMLCLLCLSNEFALYFLVSRLASIVLYFVMALFPWNMPLLHR